MKSQAAKNRFERHYFRISAKSVACFLTLWLFSGFALGTVLLLGPVRLIVMALESSPTGELQERIYVIAIIVLLVVTSFWLSLVLTRVILRTRRLTVRFLVFFMTAGAGFGAYLLWVNPRALASFMGEEEVLSAQFTFGPYPTAERLEDLKSEGYTGVVSLLHPAVVPFEPQLLARERDAAAEAGIRFIHIPMLPWVSGNEGAISQIRELVRQSSGKFYVHCYLGEDRVQLFRRIVEKIPTSEVGEVQAARPLAGRQMARGRVVELEEGVYMTPYPIESEFEGLIIFNNIRHVVALLNPEDPDDAKRIREEEKVLGAANVPYHIVPLGSENYSIEKIMDAVDMVRDLERPVVIHSFHALDSGKAPMSEAFAQAYVSGREPLAPALFGSSMTNGRPRVVAPGVATGPRPTGPEFGSYLGRRGVRSVIYVGPVTDRDRAERDKAAANEGDLQWFGLEGDPYWWISLVENEGPVYLYGPGADAAAAALAEELGPPIPGLLEEEVEEPQNDVATEDESTPLAPTI